MKRVFLISGWGGPALWFKKEQDLLRGLGYEVVVPKMTHKYLPFFLTESRNLDKYHFREDDVLVGKSLGGTLLLHYLTKRGVKVRGLFLIGVPAGGNYTNFYPTFNVANVVNWLKINLFLSVLGYPTEYEWSKVKKCAECIHLIYKDNDFLVPLEQGIFLSGKLMVDLNHTPGSDHANNISLNYLNNIFQQISD